jgi:hypothetical protein
MRGIITETRECFSSADNECVSGTQTDGKSVKRLLFLQKLLYPFNAQYLNKM